MDESRLDAGFFVVVAFVGAKQITQQIEANTGVWNRCGQVAVSNWNHHTMRMCRGGLYRGCESVALFYDVRTMIVFTWMKLKFTHKIISSQVEQSTCLTVFLSLTSSIVHIGSVRVIATFNGTFTAYSKAVTIAYAVCALLNTYKRIHRWNV